MDGRRAGWLSLSRSAHLIACTPIRTRTHTQTPTGSATTDAIRTALSARLAASDRGEPGRAPMPAKRHDYAGRHWTRRTSFVLSGSGRRATSARLHARPRPAPHRCARAGRQRRRAAMMQGSSASRRAMCPGTGQGYDGREDGSAEPPPGAGTGTIMHKPRQHLGPALERSTALCPPAQKGCDMSRPLANPPSRGGTQLLPVRSTSAVCHRGLPLRSTTAVCHCGRGLPSPACPARASLPLCALSAVRCLCAACALCSTSLCSAPALRSRTQPGRPLFAPTLAMVVAVALALGFRLPCPSS